MKMTKCDNGSIDMEMLLAISKYITDFVVISIILRFTQKLHLAAA
jgi:hypothetical protein